jgi:hypothetical protein
VVGDLVWSVLLKLIVKQRNRIVRGSFGGVKPGPGVLTPMTITKSSDEQKVDERICWRLRFWMKRGVRIVKVGRKEG